MTALPATIAVTARTRVSGFQLTSNSGLDRLEPIRVGDLNGEGIGGIGGDGYDDIAATARSTTR